MSSLSNNFLKISTKMPEQIAIINGIFKITYGELLLKVKNMVSLLVNVYNIKAGMIIAIYMNKSIDMVAIMLACNWIGTAWLPLDIKLTPFLIQKLLTQSKSDLLISSENIIYENIKSIHYSILLEKIQYKNNKIIEIINNVKDDDPCFLIYSSGTTGNPKGILATHKSFRTAFEWRYNYSYCENKYSVCSGVFFVWECLRPLRRGGILHIIEDDVLLDSDNLYNYLYKNKIDDIQLTPSLAEVVISNKWKNLSLKTLWICGELVPNKLALQLIDNCSQKTQILNLYSISEAPDVMIGDIRKIKKFSYAPLDIVCRDTTVEIINNEVIIDGPTVSPGYHLRPDINKNKFKNGKYYTGDHGFYLNNKLLITGRIDFMVKVRGYSIQLEELENTIDSLLYTDTPSILKIESYNDNPNEKILHLYISPSKKTREIITEITLHNVQKYLYTYLPNYMVPDQIHFIKPESVIDKISGKKNRKQLVNEIPKNIIDCWKMVLDKNVKFEDDFFKIGGTSIKTVRCINLYKEHLNFYIPLKIFYNYPKLSDHINMYNTPMILDEYIKNMSCKDKLISDVKNITSSLQKIKLPKWKPFKDGDTCFITGTTGYLGIFLLDKILSYNSTNIILLIRGKSINDARKRLISNSNKYLVKIENKLDKIKIYCGDLTTFNYDTITENIDVIYHCAAKVNYNETYHQLRESNVLSIEGLLYFTSNKNASFNYISSNGVYPENFGDCSSNEDIDNLLPKLENGYGQTKWAVEKILKNINYKIPIYRFGNIGPNRNSGASNMLDFQVQILKTSTDINYTANDIKFEWTSVDYIVDVIVNQQLNKIFTIVNNNLIDAINFTPNSINVSLDTWIQKCKESNSTYHQMVSKTLDETRQWLQDKNNYISDYKSVEYNKNDIKNIMKYIISNK